MAINYGVVIGLSIVAPLLVITARYVSGTTPSEHQLLGWLGIMVVAQFDAFLPLSSSVTTVLVSTGLGAAVLLIHDLVFLLREPRTPDGIT